MKIGIFIADSNGGYPVPASKGGAVSTLVEHLVKGNNKEKLVHMDIVSIYDPKAEQMSKAYPNTNFIWIKPPAVVKWLDSAFFFFVRKTFKNMKAVSYKSLFSLLFYILKAKSILKKVSYDKVVLENNVPLAWIIKLSNYNGDYYYHFHNIPRINAKCKEVFQNCTAILCVSEFVAKQIQRADNPIGPISPEKTRILYNCIDTDHFSRVNDQNVIMTWKKKYGINENEKVVVFVGRLSVEKGVDKLLEAAIKLNRKDVKVLIVGSLIYNVNIQDEYQRKLHKLAEQLGEQVKFTGYISQAELPIIYSIADIAVLPSVWDEPAGLTMIEAMACGTPVITTNAGGIPEYVSDCAFVLKRDSDIVGKIVTTIDDVLNKRDSALVTRTDRYERVNELFSAKTYMKNFIRELR